MYTEHDRSAKALLQRQREATAAKFKASETLAKQARLREKEGKEKARRRRTLINRQRRCLDAAETGGATGYGACAEGEGRNAASTLSLTLEGMDAQAVAADMSPSENIVLSARIHANREDGAAGARQQAPEGWSAQSECSSSGSESDDSETGRLEHYLSQMPLTRRDLAISGACVRAYACMHACMHVCMYACMCMFALMCVCAYVWMDR